MKRTVHFEILNLPQKKLLARLNFLGKNFYLAGGTNLAVYLNHRTSLDFDFYTPKKFQRHEIYDLLKEKLGEENIVTTILQDNTFTGLIFGINISFFYYKYPLLKPTYKINDIYLASLEDVAAMKVIAVIQRPAKRDYVDLYYLLKEFSIEKLFDLCMKKFPNFNQYLALRALTYFEDVEKESLEKRGIKILDKRFSWRKAKEEILTKVREYQLNQFRSK